MPSKDPYFTAVIPKLKPQMNADERRFMKPGNWMLDTGYWMLDAGFQHPARYGGACRHV